MSRASFFGGSPESALRRSDFYWACVRSIIYHRCIRKFPAMPSHKAAAWADWTVERLRERHEMRLARMVMV